MNPKPTTMDDLEPYAITSCLFAKIYKCLICEDEHFYSRYIEQDNPIVHLSCNCTVCFSCFKKSIDIEKLIKLSFLLYSDSSDHLVEPKSTSSTKCPNCKSDLSITKNLKSYESLCLFVDHNPEVDLDQQLSTQLNNNDTNNTEFRENYGYQDKNYDPIKQSTSELAKSKIEKENLLNELRVIKDCHDCQINGPFSKKFKVLKEQKDLVDEKNMKLIAELDSFKLNYPKAQEQIRQLTEENKRFTEQYDSIKYANQDLNSIVDKVIKCHDKMYKKNRELETKIKELEEKQEAYRKSVDQQNAQLNELTEQKNKNQRLATELDQTKSQYNEIERKLKAKNAEFEKLDVLHEAQMKAQIIQLDNFAKRKEYLEANNQQLTKEKDELKEKYLQLKIDMDELINENVSINNQNSQLMFEVEAKQVAIENLTKQKQQLELDRDRVHKSIRQTMTNFESVRQNFDELNGFID